jgi:PAS domain S-box-containing protein
VTKNENTTSLETENARLRRENRRLRQELDESRELLKAIRQGNVDAFIIERPQGPQVFTLQGAESSFRTVVETMNEGAATLTDTGTLLYCNQRFADILGLPINKVLGNSINLFLTDESVHHFGDMMRRHYLNTTRELTFKASNGQKVAVYAALSPMENVDPPSLCLVVTDISDLKRKNRELLGEALRAGQVVAYEWDSRTDRVTRSENAIDLFGYDASVGSGAEFFSLIHPDDQRGFMRVLEQMYCGRSHYRQQVRLLLSNGGLRWVEDTAEGIYDDDKKLKRIHGLLVDITERKLAEQALRESEEKFRMLSENAQAAIGIVQGMQMIYANPYLVSLSGYTFEELLQIDLIHLIHPDYRDIVLERARKRQAGEPVESHYEFVMVTRAGEFRWLDFSPVAINYHGQPAVVGIAFDITERKQAEEALRQSETRLRLTTEAANIGFWDYDLTSGSLSFSKKSRQVYGLLEKKIQFADFLHIVHPDDRERVAGDIRRAILRRVAYSDEYRVLQDDTKVRWVLSRGRTEHDNSNQPVRMAGICMDITERRHYQQQLEEITGKLDAQTKELEAIIGVVSHDLRAPLVNVQGFSAEIRMDCEAAIVLLGEAKLPSETHHKLMSLLAQTIPDSLTYIQSSAEAMNNLVRSLVEVAKAGLAASKPETLNMNEIIRHIVATLEFKIQQSETDISISKLPACHADRQQVIQIFTNLLDNAIKYLDPKRAGNICISGRTVHDKAVYCVADNGVGISPEDQQRVFQMFTRFSAKLAAGEGLGLAMVKRLVDKNNGQIELESEHGKGSSFFITLPRPPS